MFRTTFIEIWNYEALKQNLQDTLYKPVYINFNKHTIIYNLILNQVQFNHSPNILVVWEVKLMLNVFAFGISYCCMNLL